MLPTTRPWLRAYADASEREADARTAAITLAAEYIKDLRFKPLPDLIPSFDDDATDEEAIEAAAAELRLLASLDEGAPVANAIRAAERLGCIVLPADSELGRHLGMSVRRGRPPDGVCREVGGAWRSSTLDGRARARPPIPSCPAPSAGDAAEASLLEKQANRFAASFLTPADPVLETLSDSGNGRVTLQTLARVKSVWGVAIKSLVGRFRGLGMIDDSHAESLYKQISAAAGRRTSLFRSTRRRRNGSKRCFSAARVRPISMLPRRVSHRASVITPPTS